jgi:ATP-binding cassette subfamily C protein CydC
MKALRLLFPWLVRHRGRLAASVLLSLAAVLAGVGLFSVAGWFLTSAFLAGASIAFDLFAPSALVRGLSFMRIGVRYGERVAGHAATLDLLADIRTVVFGHIMALSPAQLARYQDGELAARLIGDVDALDTLFLLVIAPVLTALIIGLAFSAVAGMYVPALGWVLLAALLVGVCGVPYGLARFSRGPGRQAQHASAQARSLIHDAVAGHADMVVFAAQAQAGTQFLAAATRLSRARDRLAALGSAGQFVQQLIVGICVLALLWLGLQAFHAHTLSGPVWTGLLLGGIGLFEVLGPLMRGAARLGATASAAGRVHTLLDTQPAIDEPRDPLDLPMTGAIELSGVGYHYPGMSDAWVLDGVDLRIEPGQRVAIVGASGSGKSTLLALLMRIFDPSRGVVRYGGVPLPQASLAQLHSRFALLSQSSPVFAGTIRSNLLIGDPQADDAKLWQALAHAGLAGFVQSLPDGLDTWAGESGRSLSAGQARRVCLARALLAPAAVWVLDEPTAGLDEEAQNAFFADLSAAAAGRTVVLVTHADFPSGTFDRVFRLSQGVLQLLPQGV